MYRLEFPVANLAVNPVWSLHPSRLSSPQCSRSVLPLVSQVLCPPVSLQLNQVALRQVSQRWPRTHHFRRLNLHVCPRQGRQVSPLVCLPCSPQPAHRVCPLPSPLRCLLQSQRSPRRSQRLNLRVFLRVNLLVRRRFNRRELPLKCLPAFPVVSRHMLLLPQQVFLLICLLVCLRASHRLCLLGNPVDSLPLSLLRCRLNLVHSPRYSHLTPPPVVPVCNRPPSRRQVLPSNLALSLASNPLVSLPWIPLESMGRCHSMHPFP